MRKPTKELKIWAEEVKHRDASCVICQKTKMLNAHHIIPREILETRYNLLNGISLCPSHHRFSRKLSAHQNPLAFFMWMVRNRQEQIEYLMKKCNTILTDHGLL